MRAETNSEVTDTWNFVEKFRGAKFDRTGMIWWNVRDGWPIVSDANGRSLVTGLPIPEGQGVLLIEYKTAGQQLRNHYLYGEPPFDFAIYQKLMTKAGIIPGSVR